MSGRGRASASVASARRRYAPVFSALGDETRLSLVDKLCDRSPQSIAQLSLGTKVTRQAITKHLRILENAGLVQSVQRGRENLFEVIPQSLVDSKSYLVEVSRQWDRPLDRLKSYVE